VTRLKRDGYELHVESHGQGADILLTHGFGATARMWDEQIEEFTDRFRMIPWDLPGHGQSGAPSAGAPFDPVEDMRAVLDNAGSKRAILIGLGVGGLLSLRFWHAYPDMVRAMVLIGTIPGQRTPAVQALWNAMAETQCAALEQSGLEALEGGAEVDPGLHQDAESLARAARLLLLNQGEGALPWLASINVPVLIMSGGMDRPTLGAARHMARTIPGATAVVIPRANHAATLHKPTAANLALHAFFKGLPA
jgi:pimeloyl-ACP methyl ester carboxylesterase